MTASAWESMNSCLLGVAERLAVSANFSDVRLASRVLQNLSFVQPPRRRQLSYWILEWRVLTRESQKQTLGEIRN